MVYFIEKTTGGADGFERIPKKKHAIACFFFGLVCGTHKKLRRRRSIQRTGLRRLSVFLIYGCSSNSNYLMRQIGKHENTI